MLQGSEEANRPERSGITRKGTRERRPGPRMGTEIASLGERQPPGGAGASLPSTGSYIVRDLRHGGRRPRSPRRSRHRTPQHPTTAPGARRRGAAGFRHVPPTTHASSHSTSTLPRPVPRPNRRLRGTHSQIADAVPHRRELASQPRARSPSMDTEPGVAASSATSAAQSAVAPGNVQAGCRTAWWCASSPLAAAGEARAWRTSGWSTSSPGCSAGASTGAT
jgi:hypothetical protein